VYDLGVVVSYQDTTVGWEVDLIALFLEFRNGKHYIQGGMQFRRDDSGAKVVGKLAFTDGAHEVAVSSFDRVSCGCEMLDFTGASYE
jgi:hypothetical protein